jgi:hypothetical protein
VALALTPEFQDKWAAGDIAKLASPELATDWGERTIGNRTSFYDPVSYPNGTAWPFLNIFVSWAEYAHGNPVAGFATWSNGARLTGNQAVGDLPEHMNGDRYLAGERSVPHQLFSSVGVVVPAVRGLLGLSTSVEGGRRVLRFRPQPRPDWSFLRFSGYVAGNDRIAGEVDQQQGRTIVRLSASGPDPMTADVAVPVPPLARIGRVTLNGQLAKFEQRQVQGTNSVELRFDTARNAVVTAEYSGGIGIVPPIVDASPGDRAASLKVMQISVTGPDSLELEVAGRAGGANTLYVATTFPKIIADGATVQKAAGGYRLVIPFNDRDYMPRTIRVRAER